MLVTGGLGRSAGELVLRGLGSNPVSTTGTTGGGEDADAGLYYELLHRKRQRKIQARKAEFERSEQAQREELARQAFEAVRSAKPDLAKQIVRPHTVYRDTGPRYEVDWPRLIADLVTYEALVRLQLEMDDEDALMLMLAADY